MNSYRVVNSLSHHHSVNALAHLQGLALCSVTQFSQDTTNKHARSVRGASMNHDAPAHCPQAVTVAGVIWTSRGDKKGFTRRLRRKGAAGGAFPVVPRARSKVRGLLCTAASGGVAARAHELAFPHTPSGSASLTCNACWLSLVASGTRTFKYGPCLLVMTTPATRRDRRLQWPRWVDNTKHSPLCVIHASLLVAEPVVGDGRGRPAPGDYERFVTDMCHPLLDLAKRRRACPDWSMCSRVV